MGNQEYKYQAQCLLSYEKSNPLAVRLGENEKRMCYDWMMIVLKRFERLSSLEEHEEKFPQKVPHL